MPGQIKVIDKASLKNVIRPAVDKALDQLSKELGIAIKTGSGSFGGSTGSLKLEIRVPDENGKLLTKERQAYADYCALYELPADGLDQTIELGSKVFTVEGLNTNAPKNPVLITEVATGKPFVAPAANVKRALERVLA